MTTATPTSDRVEHSVLIRAPAAKVWKVMTDAEEFGRIFNAKLDGKLEAGAHVKGSVTVPEYEGLPFELTVDRMDPEKRFSWRWHPFAIERGVDYSKEPPTMVVLHLDRVGDATRVTLVEYGFDQLPAARRAKAHEAHVKGWTEVLKSLERAVEKHGK